MTHGSYFLTTPYGAGAPAGASDVRAPETHKTRHRQFLPPPAPPRWLFATAGQSLGSTNVCDPLHLGQKGVRLSLARARHCSLGNANSVHPAWQRVARRTRQLATDLSSAFLAGKCHLAHTFFAGLATFLVEEPLYAPLARCRPVNCLRAGRFLSKAAASRKDGAMSSRYSWRIKRASRATPGAAAVQRGALR